MKTLRLLIGIRLRSMLGSVAQRKKDKYGRPKKKGSGSVALAALLLTVLFVSFSFMAGSMLLLLALGIVFEPTLDAAFFYAISAMATLLLSVFGSVAITKNELYSAKDNDLLLSMPITPAKILVSRMVYLLLCNFYFGGIIALPAFIVHLIFFGSNLLGGLIFALGLLLQPILSLAIASFLAWGIAALLSRIRFKKLLGTLGALLGLGIYFAFCFGFADIGTYLEENIGVVIETVTPWLNIYNWLGAGASRHEILPTVLFFAVILAISALAFILLSRTYINILSVKRGEAKRIYRERKTRANGKLSALVRREFLQFFCYPMYLLNDGLGLFFAPVLGVLALVKGADLIRMMISDPEVGGIMSEFLPMLPSMLAAGLCMLGALCVISAPSLSIEGKNVWILKTLPVRAGDVLCAKAYMHIIATLPFFVPTSLMLIIALAQVMPLGFFDVVTLFLLPFAFNCLVAFLGITLNFAFPRFDHPTVAHAVKSGLSVLLTMLVATALAVAVGLLVFTPYASLMQIAVAAVLLGICLILRAYLNGRIANERFAKLG